MAKADVLNLFRTDSVRTNVVDSVVGPDQLTGFRESITLPSSPASKSTYLASGDAQHGGERRLAPL